MEVRDHTRLDQLSHYGYVLNGSFVSGKSTGGGCSTVYAGTMISAYIGKIRSEARVTVDFLYIIQCEYSGYTAR